MDSHKGWNIKKEPDPLHVIRVSMGKDYKIHILQLKGEPGKIFPDVAQKMIVPGIDKYPFFSVKEIGIAIVRSGICPYKAVKVLDNLHMGHLPFLNMGGHEGMFLV